MQTEQTECPRAPFIFVSSVGLFLLSLSLLFTIENIVRMVGKVIGVFAAVLALGALADAHGSHSESDEKDWATRHMQRTRQPMGTFQKVNG